MNRFSRKDSVPAHALRAGRRGAGREDAAGGDRARPREAGRITQMPGFYDQLAPLYHLVYQDWDASIRRQGEQLAAVIEAEWPGTRSVLDVSCGIGTQAIGLAMQGYAVNGSDISELAVDRAMREAVKRGASIKFSVCDMRNAFAHHGPGFDVVVS